MKTIIHAENSSLTQILTNINIGLYDISDYSKIKITSKFKPNICIICVEADITDDMSVFVGDNYTNNKNISFDPSVLDFIVLNDSLDEQGNLKISAISLLDLLLSSKLLDSKDNWSLESNEFLCTEIIDDSSLINLEKDLNVSDMNIMG